MLALIPVLAFAGLFLVLRRLLPADGRLAFLRAAVAWAVYMVLATELLSLFHGVTAIGLALAWLVPCLACAAWLFWRRGGRPESIRQPWVRLWPEAPADRLLLLGLAAVLVITALAAWLSPPQTWDSLTYHLSRVAHWAQQGAVMHYATGIEVQNVTPPGSEMIMLQFYVLQQSDRLTTFVSWFAMLGSLIAVSRIARSLGCGLRGQLLAAVFLGSLPMGIIQASSTIADYVVAVWVVCSAAEIVDVLVDGFRPDRLVFLSLAAGLALLTKPTAAPYLAPLAVVLAVVLLRRIRLGRSLAWGLLALALVCAVSTGHLTRNALAFGNPLATQNQLDLHRNQLGNLQGTASTLLRNFAMHLGTPWKYVNKGLGVMALEVHRWLGLDPSDPRTTSIGTFRIRAANTAEDVAGDPLQAYSILLALPALFLARKRLGRPTLILASAGLVSLVIFSWLFKWQSFGGRFHVAYFALFAPVAGRLLTTCLPKRWPALVGGIYLVAAVPWLFSIQSRPLVAIPEYSLARSILVEPRRDLYFANARYLTDTYTSLVGTIEDAGCSQVGIALSGNTPEYLFWVLLDAPRSDLRVEWLVSGNWSLPAAAEFSPCAVICEECGAGLQAFDGLPLVYVRDGYQLFMSAAAP